MKNIRKYINRVITVLAVANILLLAGCGETESGSQQTVMEERNQSTQGQIMADDAQGQPAAGDGTQMQGQAEGESQPQDQEIVSTKTQAEYEEEKRAERAMFEEKVKEADGISEEEALEIAQKAMEADFGGDAEELELSIDETFGWSSDLCTADWSEIKEKDRGTIVYCFNFNNGKKVDDFEDLINYNCTVSAVDGSILEAYSSRGLGGDTVYYEH